VVRLGAEAAGSAFGLPGNSFACADSRWRSCRLRLAVKQQVPQCGHTDGTNPRRRLRTDKRWQIANCKLQIANCKLQSAKCEMQIAKCEMKNEE
jgi:hypothetical protein